MERIEATGIGLAGALAGVALSVAAALAIAPSSPSPFDRFEAEPAATEARLIGYCDGRVLAGIEESSFPSSCDWIEPIRYLSDGGATWQAAHGRSLQLGKGL